MYALIGFQLWNLGNLKNFHLTSVLAERMTGDITDYLFPGVMSPYLYFGEADSMFPMHQEDANLYSINYHHGGWPKIW